MDLKKIIGPFFQIFGCLHGEHTKIFDILEKLTHV